MQSVIRELHNGKVSPDSKNYEQDSAYQEAIRVNNGMLLVIEVFTNGNGTNNEGGAE